MEPSLSAELGGLVVIVLGVLGVDLVLSVVREERRRWRDRRAEAALEAAWATDVEFRAATYREAAAR